MSMVTGYKHNIQIYILAMNNLKTKQKSTFIIAPKAKYLGDKSIKMCEIFYTKNYKTLIINIKGDMNK